MRNAPRSITIPFAPGHRLNNISLEEMHALNSPGGLSDTFRNCTFACLAALHFKNGNGGSIVKLQERHPQFSAKFRRESEHVVIDVDDPPPEAVIRVRGDVEVIRSLASHVRSVACDLLQHRKVGHPRSPEGITDSVRGLCSYAGVLEDRHELWPITVWGGQQIGKDEYNHGKSIGRILAMQRYKFITGGGHGTMKAPFSGARAGYKAQEIGSAPMIGLTQPGIIANEPPNELISPVVTFPDMERRLEAFVRMSLGIEVHTGGVGTMEEILYLLAILLDEKNAEHALGIVFTGPESQREWFHAVFNVIRRLVGNQTWEELEKRIRVEIGTPEEAAAGMKDAIEGPGGVIDFRDAHHMSYNWNDRLHIPPELQKPFVPSHEAMAKLALTKDLPAAKILADARAALTGIVWSHVTKEGNDAVRDQPLEIRADPDICEAFADLLATFHRDGRMNFRSEAIQAHRLVTV